jgi:hypothetical protein
MPTRQQLQSLLVRRILPALLCINLGLLLFFLVFNYQIIFHSDSAVKNLLAQEIYETGQYFPRDWNYINNDLWVFYTQTFVLPFVGLFRNGYALHVASDLISAALIIGATWKVTGMMEQSRTARLLSLIVITSGISLILAEHVWGQAAYGSMYYLGCWLAYSYWSLAHARGRARWGWAAATFVLAMLAFWANPQRAVVYYGAPVLAAALALWALDSFRPSAGGARAPGQWRWLLLLAAGSVTGVLLFARTMAHVNNIAGLTAMNWLEFPGIVNNVMATIRGFMNMFDGLPRSATAVVSLYGGYQVVRMLAALALLFLLPWSVLKAIQPHHRGRMFFAVFTAAAVAVNLLILLTTSLADMNAPEASARYLVPALLCMLLIFVGTMVDRRAVRPGIRGIGLLTIAVLATSGPVAYTSPYTLYFTTPPAALLPTEDVRLMRFLEQNGLHYGYSPFWSAGKLTVLSEGRLKIRQVIFAHGLPVPMRMLSSNRWYRPEAWQGETFLLFQDPQLKELSLDQLYSQVGKPLRRLDFETWHVLVFDKNLAVMPDWDNEARRPARYPIDAKSPHQIGRFNPAAAALETEDGEQGFLYFGPARGVPNGSYEVSFDIEAGGGGADFGTLDVVANAGKLTLASVPLTRAGRQRVALRFDTGLVDPLEFRVWKNPRGQIKLYGVEIRRIMTPE